MLGMIFQQINLLLLLVIRNLGKSPPQAPVQDRTAKRASPAVSLAVSPLVP